MALARAVPSRGRAAECLDWIERAKEINPLWPAYYDATLSSALYNLGRYEEAAQVLLRLPRLSARQEMRLAATYALMGERALAREHATRARTLAPEIDFVEAARIGWMSERESDLQHLIDGIELALGMLWN